MKSKLLPIALCGMALSSFLQAAEPINCDKVADQVRSSVEIEPAKVLVIVEDAVVANEVCVCEIVKAAIIASHATTDLAKQIMLTATNVAPNRAELIALCGKSVMSTTAGGKEVVNVNGGKEVVAVNGGKEVKQVISVQPAMAAPESTFFPADIRGVYLLQPGGGFIVEVPEDEEPPREPPPGGDPISPSRARRK